MIAAVTAVGGVLRFWDLGSPDRKVFDEVYYASDGCLYAGVPFERCGLDGAAERSWVHPPLGKYAVAWGVDGFGNRPFGWRVAAAAAGTATIALTGVLAFLLTRRALWAGVAGGLLAVESLHFVQSRIAMLDVFLTLLVVLGFLLLVADRLRRDRRDRAALAPPAEPVRLGPSGARPLRLLAGASLGAAVAVKWSGVFALLGAAVLALAWERTRRKRARAARPLAAAVVEEWPSLLLAFALVPALAYVVTWIPWLADRGWSMAEWFGHHGDMADYHLTLSPYNEDGSPIHPYMSRAWTWLLLLRPVAYFYEGTDARAAEILGIGNPTLFWGSILMIPWLILSWRRDWRPGVALAPILAQYVPWLFVARPLFLFYITPVTPFLALGAALALRDVSTIASDRRIGPLAGAAVLVVAAGLFAFFWPVLIGQEVGMDAWRARMWLPRWI